MQQVGHHLQTEAVSRGEQNGGEAYGRSSFNRYYYAVFLKARELFIEIDQDWGKTVHKDYPSKLRGKVCRKINLTRTMANKTGDFALVDNCEKAKNAALNLAGLMEKAYAVRVIADYNPEEQIQFKGPDRFKLSDTEISEAHGWISKAGLWIGRIRNIFQHINAEH